jgi:hypothetical protein
MPPARLSVLFVDDDRDILEGFALFLEIAGLRGA